jgi:hypothetical protein
MSRLQRYRLHYFLCTSFRLMPVCCILAALLLLPAVRVAALRQELELLHNAVERGYTDGEDRATAETGDRQGVGGATQRDLP